MASFINQSLLLSFRLHDWVSGWLTKHFFVVKTGLLLVAHGSLFGFFFPELRQEFGELAGNLLIGILFLSPLSKIFRMRFLQQLMGLRREMGILFGYLVLVHGLGYLTDPLVAPYFLQQISAPLLGWEERPLLFGFLAFVLTLPLLLTSNTLANRLLGGRNWKILHRTVYIMALFVVMHRFMMNGFTIVALVEMGILVGGYILAKFVAWRNFLAPLVKAITFVSSHYQAYQVNLLPQFLH